MDIWELAEQNFLISFGIVLGIGLLQGSILGRGIRRRFPRLKVHAKFVSIILLVLFSINAVANVIKFAFPVKTSFNDFSFPTTADEGLSFVIEFFGLNAGLGMAVAVFVSITLMLFFRFADLPNIARYFVFSLSAIVLLVSLVGRFTDFVPNFFQILLYAFYQLGITLGLFLVTKRKTSDVFSKVK